MKFKVDYTYLTECTLHVDADDIESALKEAKERLGARIIATTITSVRQAEATTSRGDAPTFKVGDRVRITNDLESLINFKYGITEAGARSCAGRLGRVKDVSTDNPHISFVEADDLEWCGWFRAEMLSPVTKEEG